jgi:hypothetical protein
MKIRTKAPNFALTKELNENTDKRAPNFALTKELNENTDKSTKFCFNKRTK